MSYRRDLVSVDTHYQVESGFRPANIREIVTRKREGTKYQLRWLKASKNMKLNITDGATIIIKPRQDSRSAPWDRVYYFN